MIEVKKAEGGPINRKYLAKRLNCAESLVKHDIEWLLEQGVLIFVKHGGNKGAIYKVAKK